MTPQPVPAQPGDMARAQPTIIAPAQAALEALAHTREQAIATRQATDVLLELAERQQQPPEMRPIVINPGNNGQYVTVDKSRFQARSIGILNASNVPVFIGIGGVTPTAAARAPVCAAQSFLVLPVLAQDLELGCDPAVLAGNTAVVYLFRYLSVQPLAAGANR